MRRLPQALRQDTRGTAAVELALVMPIMLVFLVGLLEYGRVIWTTQALESVGQQTARCVAIKSNACPTPSSFATSLAGGYGVTALAASGVAVITSAGVCGTASTGSNTFVQVTLTVPFTTAAGKLLTAIPTSLTTVACFPVTGS